MSHTFYYHYFSYQIGLDMKNNYEKIDGIIATARERTIEQQDYDSVLTHFICGVLRGVVWPILANLIAEEYAAFSLVPSRSVHLWLLVLKILS